MTSASAAANALSTLGAICWSIQLLPQLWINYRRQHTHGLQPTMMLLWASAGIPLGIYNITRDFPVALWIQPQILTVLSLGTWVQTRYYPPGEWHDKLGSVRAILWGVVALCSLAALAGGIEVGIIFALRTATRHRSQADIEYYWPVVLMGVLSAVLLCAGVSRHYVDIWKERTVRGISFVFVAIDALGDLTSLLGVICWWKAGRSLDVFGIVVYASELVLWIGVMICGAWYNLRPWLKQKLRGQMQFSTATVPGQSIELSQSNGTEDSERSTGMRNGSGTDGEYENVIRDAELRARHPTHARMGSTSGSIASSQASYSSGTVFRTASERAVTIGAESSVAVEHESSRGHNVLKLRSIVQV